MKNLKMFQAAIVIFVVSFFVGCRDQLTSSGESENFKSDKITGEEVDKRLSLDNYFRIQIRLKPHRAYTFNASNTGFVEFNSIDVENLYNDPNSDKYIPECQDIKIYGSISDSGILNCHSKGFNLKEIIVENTSSKMIDLDIALSGVKKKYEVPIDSE